MGCTWTNWRMHSVPWSRRNACRVSMPWADNSLYPLLDTEFTAKYIFTSLNFTQTHYSTYLCASIHIVSMSFNDPSLLTLGFVEEVFEQTTQFFLMIRDRSTFVNAKFTVNLKISLQIKEVEP